MAADDADDVDALRGGSGGGVGDSSDAIPRFLITIEDIIAVVVDVDRYCLPVLPVPLALALAPAVVVVIVIAPSDDRCSNARWVAPPVLLLPSPVFLTALPRSHHSAWNHAKSSPDLRRCYHVPAGLPAFHHRLLCDRGSTCRASRDHLSGGIGLGRSCIVTVMLAMRGCFGVLAYFCCTPLLLLLLWPVGVPEADTDTGAPDLPADTDDDAASANEDDGTPAALRNEPSRRSSGGWSPPPPPLPAGKDCPMPSAAEPIGEGDFDLGSRFDRNIFNTSFCFEGVELAEALA
uniref:Uncharacterized protein n=1 Tax=Anopheles farauti TaxID=69004 RepID=A0A182QQJ8_9DIPT